jgi:hypothetical protein
MALFVIGMLLASGSGDTRNAVRQVMLDSRKKLLGGQSTDVLVTEDSKRAFAIPGSQFNHIISSLLPDSPESSDAPMTRAREQIMETVSLQPFAPLIPCFVSAALLFSDRVIVLV